MLQYPKMRIWLNRIARRFVESSWFRYQSLGIFLIVLAGMVLAVIANPLERGLLGRYYHAGDCTGDPELKLRERSFTLWRMKGEPAEVEPTYSIEWTGEIFISVAGEYQFSTVSDDGSELWLNNQQVVDNSGVHGPQARHGSIYLQKGFYQIVLRYMQWGGGAGFRAYWTPPGETREKISHAPLFVKKPAPDEFLIGRVLETFFTLGFYFCIIYVSLGFFVWLNSRQILLPFLKNARIGKLYSSCRSHIMRPGMLPKVQPSPPKSSFSTSLLALLGYTVLSLVWTYPLIVNFSSKMFGLGGDRYIHLWNMWWLKKAVFELHVNPLFTDYLFYPKGISLAFHDFSLYNALLSLPLQAFFSLEEIYNLLFLSTFILGGFGCFLLTRHFTGDHLAAFLSGLVFAFWGGRMYYVDHLSLASIQWFPYCALYLVKTLREPSYRNPVLAALFLVMNALSAWYYAIYMTLFIALFLFYFAIAERKTLFTAACLKRFGLAGLLTCLIMLPVAYPMFSQILTGQEYMVYQLLTTESANPNVLFFPSVNHPIIGKYVRYLYEKYELRTQVSLSGAAFIGYTVIALCLYTVIRLKHVKKGFWIIVCIMFLLLSLGPHLQLFSKEYLWIPLPHLLLQHIPILKIMRVPVRFMVMVMLCCSVLAGYACWDIFRRIRIRKLLFTFLTALILFEFFRVFYVTPVDKTPEFYKELGQEQADYAILEITRPMVWSFASTRASLFQISHGKKLFHGHVSRVSLDTYHQAYLLYPVFDDLFTRPQEKLSRANGRGISLGADSEAISALLSFYNVKYVALFYDYWTGEFEENRAKLQSLFGKAVGKPYGGMAVFQVEKTPVSENLVFPGLGMFHPEFYPDHPPFRKTANNADIKLINVEGSTKVRIRFEGKRYKLAKEQVEISVNGTLIDTATIVREWTEVNIPPVPVNPGENTIRLRTLDNDDRKYGIYVRNFEIEFIKYRSSYK